MEGLIDQVMYDVLNTKYPREATFYALPKIHKKLSSPPGRPIISGIGSLTENASKLVDCFLMPHMIKLPSHIKDSQELLKHTERMSVPTWALLVTLDVEALYSSMSQELGVGTLRTFFRELDHSQWSFSEFVT